jgi:hypothetical protein
LINVLFYSLLLCFFFIINILIVYSLFNAGLLSMGKGKADGTGFLTKLTTMASRSGRARTVPPPDYLRMTPHREVEGEVPLEEEGAGGEPLEEHGVGARNSAPSPT